MTYRKDLDALKGIAIIAVVLFHMGLLKSGYLGVDAFFVINGLLVVPAVCSKVATGDFKYFSFMEKKLLRLWPLVIVASAVCLFIGFMGMLPDNYENLAESVVAGNLFSENILSAITTKNYWAVGNDYKPLMHLWYVGILMEFYLVLPLLLMGCKKVLAKFKGYSENWLTQAVAVMFVISLLLYLLPGTNEMLKFYYVQYRFFELLAGGLVGLILNSRIENRGDSIGLQWVINLLLIIVIVSSLFTFSLDSIGTQVAPIGGKDIVKDELIQSKPTLLLLTVFLTCLFLLGDNSKSRLFGSNVLAYFGKRSYSIFIWHQVILAFYRYFVSNQITIPFVIGFLVVAVGISELSYRFIEQKIKVNHKSFIGWALAAVLVTIPAGWIYMHAGVVRDVPEQNITFNNVHRNMHAEYCDRVYAYDKDFPEVDNGKINVLVEGVSFGRDFANCILESEYADSVNLSYVFTWDEKYAGRVAKADKVFSFTSKNDVPLYVWNSLKDGAEVWGIGTKNYGESNGIVYAHRRSEGYKDYSIPLNENYRKLNDQWAREWGDNYINFVEMATVEGGNIRVFTPDGKFISQDCEHLTKEGAQWYAKIIDWSSVFNK